MSAGLHVKCSLFLSDFHETWNYLSTDLRKILIQFRENPSNGSRVVLCGRIDIHETNRGMLRITTFRPTTDHIYDGGPIRLYYYSGRSSNSGYSLLVGLCALAQIISYEVRLAFILLSFVVFVCRSV
jgi:hypothetical protein